MKRGRLVILLAEDDDNDIFFVRRATQASNAGHTVHAVHDGAQAIEYLRGQGAYADREKFPLPNIILTDLKMAGMDGFDLLRWLHDNPDCSVIPTIVYSSSTLEADVRLAYRCGANAYIKKPGSVTELAETLGLIYDFWSRCEIPPPLGSP